MQTIQLTREFRYNGVRLADPSPNFTLEQVRDFYANTYPEILNAEIDGPAIEGEQQVYSFRRAVGTKGNELAALREKISDGTLWSARNDNFVDAGHLNQPAAKILRETTQRYRSSHGRSRNSALVPTSASLQVLA